MIRNVVEAIEQLSDGLVYATVVFYADDGTDYKERWQTVVQPATPDQLIQLITAHTVEVQARIVDPAVFKRLTQLLGTEMQVSVKQGLKDV